MAFFIGATLFSVQSIGQTDSLALYNARHPECITPKLEMKSEIIKDDGNRIIYLRFENKIPDYFELTNEIGTPIEETMISLNELIFEVGEQVDFSIHLINSCGEIESAHYAKSIESQDESDFIVVSPDMGKLLSKFTYGNVPLLEFLRNDNTVNFFQKIEFFQNYALEGLKINIDEFDNPISASSLDELDAAKEKLWDGIPPPAPEVNCKCDLIKIVPHHSSFLEASGGLAPWFYSYKGSPIWQFPHEDIGAGGDKWGDLVTLGASKWFHLQTQGYKRKKTHEEAQSEDVGDHDQEGTGLRGEIGVLLLCMDGERLPAECGCNKKGTFNYRYDSRVEAKAIVHSGGTGKKWRRAEAMTTDEVIVYCYFPDEKGLNIDNYIPINGIINKAAAQCKTEINPDFWPTLEDFGGDIIDILTDENGELFHWEYTYSYDSTLIKIDTLQNPPLLLDSIYRIDTIVIDSNRVVDANGDAANYKNLLSSIIKVINTPYFDTWTCTGDNSFNDLKGTFKFTVEPNKTVTLGVLSLGRCFVSGRRSWHSMANMASEYSMSVVVNPGKTGGDEADCCTPWIAGYLVGGAFITGSKIMQYQVGSDLNLLSFEIGNPNGLSLDNGGYFVRGEKGVMSHPPFNGECHVPFRPAPLQKPNRKELIFDQIKQHGGQVTVFDAKGQLVGNFSIKKDTEQVLLQTNRHVQSNIKISGIYFIQLTSNGVTYTYKLPVTK